MSYGQREDGPPAGGNDNPEMSFDESVDWGQDVLDLFGVGESALPAQAGQFGEVQSTYDRLFPGHTTQGEYPSDGHLTDPQPSSQMHAAASDPAAHADTLQGYDMPIDTGYPRPSATPSLSYSRAGIYPAYQDQLLTTEYSAPYPNVAAPQGYPSYSNPTFGIDSAQSSAVAPYTTGYQGNIHNPPAPTFVASSSQSSIVNPFITGYQTHNPPEPTFIGSSYQSTAVNPFSTGHQFNIRNPPEPVFTGSFSQPRTVNPFHTSYQTHNPPEPIFTGSSSQSSAMASYTGYQLNTHNSSEPTSTGSSYPSSAVAPFTSYQFNIHNPPEPTFTGSSSQPRGTIRGASYIQYADEVPQNRVQIAHEGLPGVAGHYARAAPQPFVTQRDRPPHRMGTVDSGSGPYQFAADMPNFSSAMTGVVARRSVASQQRRRTNIPQTYLNSGLAPRHIGTGRLMPTSHNTTGFAMGTQYGTRHEPQPQNSSRMTLHWRTPPTLPDTQAAPSSGGSPWGFIPPYDPSVPFQFQGNPQSEFSSAFVQTATSHPQPSPVDSNQRRHRAPGTLGSTLGRQNLAQSPPSEIHTGGFLSPTSSNLAPAVPPADTASCDLTEGPSRLDSPDSSPQRPGIGSFPLCALTYEQQRYLGIQPPDEEH